MTKHRWTAVDLPDLTCRTVVVTGAASGAGRGAGRGTATAFAAPGARTVLAVRDVSAGERVAAAMSCDTEVRALDLSFRDPVTRAQSQAVGPYGADECSVA